MPEERRLSYKDRLAKAAAFLERLDQERFASGDSGLGKAVECRIIWRELLDLELQEFDEEIERLAEAVQNLPPAGGTAAHAWGEIQHPLPRKDPLSRWRYLGGFLR